MRNKFIKVVIAEDHAFLRDGLSTYLNLDEEIEVVAEASCGKDLISKVGIYKPDVIITDLMMPGLSGAELIEELSGINEERIVVHSLLDNEAVILNILRSGAMSYVIKGEDREELVRAVKSSYNYQPYFCGLTTIKVKGIMKSFQLEASQKWNLFSELELQIIKLICLEKTSTEIAGELYKSKKYIDRARTNIFEKMNVKSTVGMVKFAITNLLLPWERNDLGMVEQSGSLI